MSENAIDSDNMGKPALATVEPNGARKAGKKARAAKKAGRANKPANKPKADRTNKKAEVIEMMKPSFCATYSVRANTEAQLLSIVTAPVCLSTEMNSQKPLSKRTCAC